MANRRGEWKQYRFSFLGLQNHCGWWLQLWNLKKLASWKENYNRPRQRIKKSRDITLPKTVCIVKAIVFSSSHIQMWELDHKEGWALKNWCFQTVVLVKTLESPLHFKDSESVSPKGNQLWIYIGRTDTEAEVPVFWPPDVKSQLTGKDPERLRTWREGDGRGWADWMASMDMSSGNSRRWWRTGKPGVLQSMGW